VKCTDCRFYEQFNDKHYGDCTFQFPEFLYPSRDADCYLTNKSTFASSGCDLGQPKETG
jgi:hypothetical protein